MRKRPKYSRNFFLYVSFLIGVIAVLFFSLKETELPKRLAKGKNEPDFAFEHIVISHIDGEKLLWELTANKALIFKKENESVLENIQGAFFNEWNKPVVRFSSPQASLALDSSNLHLSDVTATFNIKEDNIQLLGKLLVWTAETQELSGRGDIIILSQYGKISGNAFKASIPYKTFQIQQDGKAVFRY